MPHVGLEPVLFVERFHQRCRGLGRQLGNPAAVAADQVDVLGLGREVVAGRSVAQVGVADEAELLEQFQGPVDRGDVDPAGPLVHLGEDLLRRCVVQSRNGLENELTLRGHPVAAGPQRGVPRLRHEPSLGERTDNALASMPLCQRGLADSVPASAPRCAG